MKNHSFEPLPTYAATGAFWPYAQEANIRFERENDLHPRIMVISCTQSLINRQWLLRCSGNRQYCSVSFVQNLSHLRGELIASVRLAEKLDV
jgi:hypothetical protein